MGFGASKGLDFDCSRVACPRAPRSAVSWGSTCVPASPEDVGVDMCSSRIPDAPDTGIALMDLLGTSERGHLDFDFDEVLISTPKPRGLTHDREQGRLVHCSEGHLMRAHVVKEVVPVRDCFVNMACDLCAEHILLTEAYYRCSPCSISYCTSCAREQLHFETQSPAGSSSVLSVGIGDIVLCGPTEYGIHHAILVCSELQKDYELAPQVHLEPGVEVWCCKSIQSTQGSVGDETWWFSATLFLARDPSSRTAALLADLAEDSDTIEVSKEPVPIKVLLHPLREESGGPGLDADVFLDVVRVAASESKEYGWSTAARALSGYVPPATLEMYPSPEAREEFLESMHERWQSKSICSAVVIKVWQMYLEAMNEDADEAAKDIMAVMPCACDATAPSTMITELSQRGWALHSNLEA